MPQKNFIDFIIDAKDRPDLYDGFLANDEAKDLQAFFKEGSYYVSLEDCEKLIKAKSDLGIEVGKIPPAY